MIAIVIGATGLVGRACLAELLGSARYSKVRAVVRRKLELAHPKLEQILADFENLSAHEEAFRGDALFCCLGTTIKSTGSKQAFRRIDHGYTMECAQLASARGVKTLILVSSVGADASSRYFYPRVKGEIEQAVAALPFEAVHIFRPSFLMGKRPNNQKRRPGEQLAIAALNPARGFFIGPLRKYQPVHASKVAQAMVRASLDNGPFHERARIYEGASI